MKEIFLAFFKFGWTAFGGPAAHIGLMETEFIEKRKWITRQEFLDLMGFTNLIPGPNSTEMTMGVGYLRGGYPGLFLAGFGFILPAFLITLSLAMAYVYFGDVTWMEGIFNALMPVILAVIFSALYRFSKNFLSSPMSIVIAVAAAAASLLGLGEIPVLFGGALIMWLFRKAKQLNAIEPISLSVIFLGFLKIGTFLYGTGYVLLAFLQTTFVETGLLSAKELIDSVAVSQFTPGPLFTVATFIGYLMHGVWGSVLATIGIFVASFTFMALLIPHMKKLRKNKFLSTLLDGINAAALGLMAAVTLTLALVHLDDIFSIMVAGIALVLLLRTKVNPTWLILIAAAFGVIRALFF
ncbi:MAG TPA: chromate transporter [Tissierellia bacterium]|nr:chromate transporter [Tissierellia bacterium]